MRGSDRHGKSGGAFSGEYVGMEIFSGSSSSGWSFEGVVGRLSDVDDGVLVSLLGGDGVFEFEFDPFPLGTKKTPRCEVGGEDDGTRTIVSPGLGSSVCRSRIVTVFAGESQRDMARITVRGDCGTISAFGPIFSCATAIRPERRL